jgi:hypothetical protein
VIWENQSGTSMLSPWIGFAVFCGYAAIALIGGLILFRERDAQQGWPDAATPALRGRGRVSIMSPRAGSAGTST